MFWSKLWIPVKVRLSEETIKLFNNLLVLTLLTKRQNKWKIFSDFVAFSPLSYVVFIRSDFRGLVFPWVRFLTAILHRGLKNDFFSIPIYFFRFLFGLLLPYLFFSFSLWTFIQSRSHFGFFQIFISIWISQHYSMYFRSFRRKMEISKLSRRFCRQIFP